MINEERYPLNGTFELTGRCNLSCKMCLVRIGQQQICESGMRERTAGEWIDMAEQVRDAGTFSLLLTGGEVMLRPDFCEIYEAISKMGFILTVYTNATMVTDEIMGMLAAQIKDCRPKNSYRLLSSRQVSLLSLMQVSVRQAMPLKQWNWELPRYC